jgi:MoxR-like ATPase
MKLLNLKELIVKFQDEVKNLEFKDIRLPKDFMADYAAFVTAQHPSGFEGITWADHTAHITTTAKQNIFVPNFWFLMASKLAKLIEDLEIHKSVFMDIFGKQDTKEIAKNLQGGVSNYETTIKEYFNNNGRTPEELNNFIQFVSEYDEWGGGKTIDRGDYYVSAVLSSANLVAASHGSVAILAHQMFENRELWQKLSSQLDALNPSKIYTPLNSKSSLQEFPEQANVDFTKAGLRVSDGLLLRFGAALLAKRFLILTGLSGSGKTKLAHAFASWLTESKDQYRLVAVGADWTTNENVVGYQDALQPDIYRKPSNGLLEVVLRAAADTERPYFLILDEMNLSHVERYFADILSAIESRQEIALHSSAESLKSSEHDTLLVPSKISLPNNLFIIGTVNVDETTYMFSPKVLDRANVIEFRATADDIAAFLDAPSAVNMELLEGKGAAFGAAFVAEAAAEVQLKGEIAAELKNRLAEVFVELAKIGAEFGFRTAYEISRFTYFHDKLTGEGWQFNDALDAQVLQKLMPKLHGSQRRLEPVLKALEAFCNTHHCNASLEKIKRMQERLKDGFASFAEG